MSERRIRRAEEQDLDRLVVLEALTSSTPWHRDALREELHRTFSRVYVALSSDDVVIAYVSAWLVADEVQILNVATDPEWRRHGHARALLEVLQRDAMERGATTMTLEVRAGNQAAITLYERLGFTVDGRRKGYYTDGEDAVLMTLVL